MYPRYSSLPYFLALLFLSNLTIALTPWEEIHQALHVYAVSIDTKNYAQLSLTFTPTATANYTGANSNLTGLANIETALGTPIAGINTQHLLGTTVIDIHADGQSANTTTYFLITLFGDPYTVGSLLTIYGEYDDVFVKTAAGWRVSKRQLVYSGPGLVGNLSVIGR